MAWLIQFFSDEPKLINRNENAYKSGRMEEFALEMAIGFLKGRVRSSLKDRAYSVEVSLRNSGLLCSHVGPLVPCGPDKRMRSIRRTLCSWLEYSIYDVMYMYCYSGAISMCSYGHVCRWPVVGCLTRIRIHSFIHFGHPCRMS